ncbi:MAG: hypothetical protein DME48_10225 [Verrucomicrobia bacterium]|nr:MAG: hypothetical protein DME48_10225 [Verrucomicrobiota bacterium]
MKNIIWPPIPSNIVLALVVKKVPLPAVALLVNAIVAKLAAPTVAATRFCAIPELFVIPVPLMVNVNGGVAVIVKALAPGLNTMLFTSVLAETKTPVVLDVANVAVSDAPLREK